jgi:hypothetical protein
MDKLKDLLESGKITQEVYDALTAEFNRLISQRDEARREAAERRVKLKELKDKSGAIEKLIQEVGDKLGVDLSEEDSISKLEAELSKLGGVKKEDLDKLREYEAKYKRLAKEREELEAKLQKEHFEKISILKKKELGSKLSKFEVVDRDAAEALLDSRIVIEDDGSVKFKTKDGVAVGLEEGLEEFFKEEKPNLLKGYGKPGSGVESGGVLGTLRNSNNADDILKAAGVK